MAFVTADHTNAPAGTGLWASLVRGFEAYAYRRARLDQVDALNAKTDAELADMGVERERIVQYVFRDLIS